MKEFLVHTLRLRKGLVVLVALAAFAAWPAVTAASGGSTTVTVNAAGSGGNIYTLSGVTLAGGQQAAVTATGTWDTCGGGCRTGPDGFPFFDALTDPTAAAGSLIGSLDGGASWFAIGSGPTTVTGPGTLLLADNDYPWGYYDESGSLSVTITLLAPPMPSDASQCKKNGWQSYGVFKNQGDCVSYVATHGRNQPAG
jgi:hypothetical protein